MAQHEIIDLTLSDDEYEDALDVSYDDYDRYLNERIAKEEVEVVDEEDEVDELEDDDEGLGVEEERALRRTLRSRTQALFYGTGVDDYDESGTYDEEVEDANDHQDEYDNEEEEEEEEEEEARPSLRQFFLDFVDQLMREDAANDMVEHAEHSVSSGRHSEAGPQIAASPSSNDLGFKAFVRRLNRCKDPRELVDAVIGGGGAKVHMDDLVKFDEASNTKCLMDLDSIIISRRA
ncbi:hypothetical protein DM01DRAFT_1411906 [Hesseltinella vesiculosa]|uniref:Uncharacterized protein n=1 Tax=Hesseltinella vesiculosa TaxID=101127 RepID=A0A1X2G1Z4_9FUNG|nr:hypothetical protein DM01DRAFT_1411906 [Hesseltinella vesiculosa]